MQNLRYRKTAFIETIIKLYQTSREQYPPKFIESMNFETAKQGWLAYFGLQYEEGFGRGLQLPTQGNLASLVLQRISEMPDNEHFKRQCQYYHFIYNTCYEYIADNQNRYFGQANLEDLSHGKVFAMALLAHLCKQALSATEVDRKAYEARIQAFAQALLLNQEIQNSKSNDSGYLSCVSALERIYEAEDLLNEASPDNQIIQFFQLIHQTVASLAHLESTINAFVLPLLISQDIDLEMLKRLSARENDTTLTKRA